jgi:putative tryptophan/tyrosine transport system substrate-binding protein
MRRLEFVQAIVLSIAWPLIVCAQQVAPRSRIAKLGVLWHGDSENDLVKTYRDVLIRTLSGLGYVEGKSVQFLQRYSSEPLRLRELAKELVDQAPDVIITSSDLAAIELKRATTTIPIVFATSPNPVRSGLVESLARPGGNVTGLSIIVDDLAAKRLSLFKEAVPSLRRIALLADPKWSGFALDLSSNSDAAKALGLELRLVEVPSAEVIAQTFSAIAQNGFDGAIATGAMALLEGARIGASALSEKMPTTSGAAESVPYGLLMSYGIDFSDLFRRAAGYVDKILKGARPADLPVEQPTRFKLVINLKVARALGLNIPRSLLASADDVIE